MHKTADGIRRILIISMRPLLAKALSWWLAQATMNFIRNSIIFFLTKVDSSKYRFHICIQNLNLAITVPADGLAPNGARPSAGTVLTANYHISFTVLLMINEFDYIFLSLEVVSSIPDGSTIIFRFLCGFICVSLCQSIKIKPTNIPWWDAILKMAGKTS